MNQKNVGGVAVHQSCVCSSRHVQQCVKEQGTLEVATVRSTQLIKHGISSGAYLPLIFPVDGCLACCVFVRFFFLRSRESPQPAGAFCSGPRLRGAETGVPVS